MIKKIIFPVFCALLICPQISHAASEQGKTSSKASNNRIKENQKRRNLDFTDLGNEYSEFKNKLSKDYNFDYSIDFSYMPQVGAPNGKNTSEQSMLNTSASWQAFKNDYGTGSFNFAYNVVRYGGISGNKLGDRIGVGTPVNDFPGRSTSFDEFLYTHQMPGELSWLSVSLGQFPMYNFDGSTYNSNQQVNFINYALSQNATSTYPVASLGGYVTITPNSEWSFSLGGQDANDISGQSIQTDNLNSHEITSFGSVTYSPTIQGLGQGAYSLLLYNQPSIPLQKGTTNGWSVNLSQDISEKWNVFARVNGVSGDVAFAEMSYVLGGVWNNPLDRNPLDQIGLAGTINKMNNTVIGETNRDYENIVETYWAWGISKWATITPDVQVYFNPASNQKSDTDTVLSLRATLFF